MTKKFNPTLPQIHELRAALMVLEKEGPEREVFGICHNLERYAGAAATPYDMVAELSVNWPLREGRVYCGVCAYPIHRDYKDGRRLPLWEGRQLDMRLSLIRHLDAELAKLERAL